MPLREDKSLANAKRGKQITSIIKVMMKIIGLIVEGRRNTEKAVL